MIMEMVKAEPVADARVEDLLWREITGLGAAITREAESDQNLTEVLLHVSKSDRFVVAMAIHLVLRNLRSHAQFTHYYKFCNGILVACGMDTISHFDSRIGLRAKEF